MSSKDQSMRVGRKTMPGFIMNFQLWLWAGRCIIFKNKLKRRHTVLMEYALVSYNTFVMWIVLWGQWAMWYIVLVVTYKCKRAAIGVPYRKLNAMFLAVSFQFSNLPICFTIYFFPWQITFSICAFQNRFYYNTFRRELFLGPEE